MGDRKAPTPPPQRPDSDLQHYVNQLGLRVRDVVTGLEGVITSITFDLYGCVQALVSSGLDEKGETRPGQWFDLKRLVPQSDDPVMPVPTFGHVPGGQELPLPSSSPTR